MGFRRFVRARQGQYEAPMAPAIRAENHRMLVRTRFRPRRKDDAPIELPDGATVADLMAAVGESVDITVAVRAGVPIAEDEPLVAGEEILLLSAASGG